MKLAATSQPFSDSKSSTGSPHCDGSGLPAVMSAGIDWRWNSQIFTDSSRYKIQTPPPAALKPTPYDELSPSATPQPPSVAVSVQFGRGWIPVKVPLLDDNMHALSLVCREISLYVWSLMPSIMSISPYGSSSLFSVQLHSSLSHRDRGKRKGQFSIFF